MKASWFKYHVELFYLLDVRLLTHMNSNIQQKIFIQDKEKKKKEGKEKRRNMEIHNKITKSKEIEIF